MDIVYSRSDLIGIFEAGKGFEQLHLRTRGLDGDDICIHGGDVFDYIVEFAIAHMRVDLCFVFHAACGDAEGFHGPIQIHGTILFTQRQAFADRGLIDLNDLDAGLFEGHYLVADGEGNLVRRHRTGLIVTDEGPLQDRHRPGEHPFHELFGVFLRKCGPTDRHIAGTAHIPEDDGRLYATAAIALDPAVLGEDKSFELFTEIFYHIIALEFAMNEDVETYIFLPPDDFDGGRFDGFVVLHFGEFAFFKLRTQLTDLVRLREGADGRGREEGELIKLELRFLTFMEGAFAFRVALTNGVDSLLYRLLVDQTAGTPALNGVLVSLQEVVRAWFVGCDHFKIADLLQFLFGKGHPVFDLIGQGCFQVQIEGRMQERRTGGDENTIGA